jgi:hypothetical protein
MMPDEPGRARNPMFAPRVGDRGEWRVAVIAVLGWIGALSGDLMVSGAAAGKAGAPTWRPPWLLEA